MSPTIDGRRRGDSRPKTHEAEKLNWHPSAPLRLLPRHGQPYCRVEWLSQAIVRQLADFRVYALVLMLAALALYVAIH